MAINIISASYSDNYTGIYSGLGTDTGSSYLIGEIGDTMFLSLDFNIAWSSQNVPCLFTASNVIRYDQGNYSTDGFVPGDIFVITNTTNNNGTYSIFNISTDGSTITIMTTFTNGLESSASFFGITPIKAIDLYYNVIQNGSSQTFTSLSDPTSIQRLTAYWNSATPSNTSLLPNGASRAWWEGLTSSLTQYPTVGFTQSFNIIHNFEIKPWYLAGQLINFTNETPPKYFQKGNCYQHIYQIVGRYSSTDPNQEHVSSNTIPLSNTGWYNEFLNGNCPTYELGTITYKINGITQSEMDYINPTEVIATLVSTTETFATGSKIDFQFSWLPSSSNSYQNSNCRELASNYNQLMLRDSCMQIIGSSSKNGINYGTPFQVFENVTIIGSGNIATASFTINPGSYVSQTLSNNAPTNTNYLLTATPQEGSITNLLNTDRTAVILDVNQATTNPDDATLLEYIGPTLFYRYPDTGVNPVTNISLFNGDYTYASMSFIVATNSNMTNFNVQIIATNAIGDTIGQEYVLESWTNNTSPTFDGISNQVNIAQLRNFNLPDGSIQNIRSIERTTSFDTATWSGYQLIYGFQADYRYYLQVSGVPQSFVNSPFSCWSIYDNYQPGWNLSFKTIITVTTPETNDITQFINYSPIQVNDYTNNPTMSITYQTYDNNGNNLGGNISNGMQTEVIWSFLGTGSFTTIPTGYDGYQAQLYFSYDNGTQTVFDMDDTDTEPIGLWIGTPIINVISDDLIEVSGILDLTGQNITNYRMYAKLGYTTQPIVISNIALLEPTGQIWFLEDGTIQYLEN